MKEPKVARQTLITAIDTMADSAILDEHANVFNETIHDTKVLDFVQSLEDGKKIMTGLENMATSNHLVTTITFFDKEEYEVYKNTLQTKKDLTLDLKV
jgi:hypothetical protein